MPQADYYGRVRLLVRVGDSESEPAAATLAGVSRTTPLWVSLAIVAALALGLYWLIARGVSSYRIDGATYGLFAVLFLDKETDTYSLSKLQLDLWTAAAVFCSLHDPVAYRAANVPENLPGIILVSAGTAAAARGITAARGPKGAGDVRSSFADFVTAGGVVMAERFQFLVWTVLGVAALLFVTVVSDPATIQELRKVPEGFLYLMGVSTAGYLGGKLARKPGRILDSVVAHLGSVVIDIKGRNLSHDATIQIDGQDVLFRLRPSPAGLAAGVATALATENQLVLAGDLEVRQRDPAAAQPDFATGMRLTIPDPKGWLTARGLAVAEVSACARRRAAQAHPDQPRRPDGRPDDRSQAVCAVTAPRARSDPAAETAGEDGTGPGRNRHFAHRRLAERRQWAVRRG